MADPRRAWLALQRDLGGDEILLDRPLDGPVTLGAAEPARAPTAARRTPAEPVAPPSTPEVPVSVEAPLIHPGYPEGAEPAWFKGAPEIPGYGMAIRTPVPPLVGGAPAWSSLDEVAAAVAGCTKCPLCTGRTNTVPGEGNPEARLMVIGEGPGENEDLQGRPFVGRAGELLDKMLLAIDAARPTVFIANVVKCRPPRNRAPLPDEREACLPYLHRQIALVRPKVLLALGSTAAEALLGVKKPLGELRSKVHRLDGIPLVVTYHPAALLRNPNWKRPAWDDVRIARQLLDIA